MGAAKILDMVDSRMDTLAAVVPLVLGERYFDSLSFDPSLYLDERTFDQGRDALNVLLDSSTSEMINVEALFVVVEYERKVYVVATSRKKHPLSGNRVKPFVNWALTNNALMSSFQSSKPHYVNANRSFGQYRSLYLPYEFANGLRTVVGVEVSASEVARIHSLMRWLALFSVGFLAFLGLPFILFSRSSLKNEIIALTTDSLVGLPNRMALMSDIGRFNEATVAMININGFSKINFSYGSAAADNILSQVAQSIQSYFSDENDIRVYRLAADRFGVLVPRCVSNFEMNSLFRTLADQLHAQSFSFPGKATGSLRFVIGVANSNAGPVLNLLTYANLAIIEANIEQVEFKVLSEYQQLPNVFQRELRITQKAVESLKNNGVTPYFQPVFRAEDFTVVHYEVLLRIEDNMGKSIARPDEMLTLLRQQRLELTVTKQLLEKSLKIAHRHNLCCSFNLSPSLLQQDPALEMLASYMRNYSKHMMFELAENEALLYRDVTQDFFREAKKIGVPIGIDEFGKQFSNVDRLISLQVDFIKIDGRLVSRITQNQGVHNTVKGLIELANQQGIDTVAQHCESEHVVDAVKQLDVVYLQGFYLCQPMNQEALEQFLLRQNEQVNELDIKDPSINKG
ncbi:hypothetical protein GCM10007877_36080 [Marinibactrum halimedae]|uniref:GGDEF domain-containing protein n=2 Tax=Marinibactrum halimedae TaxID=1444977 RepID=A0AA37WN99_9GAMM|nr:hypothetical protein GCM10007877_36080 [Marinibactrum halimedae]